MKFKSVKLHTVLFLLTFGLLQWAMAQQKTVTGTVTVSETGEPLIGATVMVKGTTLGTTTNIDGQYSLSVSKDQTLVFSFIGFISQEVLVGGQATINVSLSQSTEDLGEVVVIGYGQVKKSDATGSVSAIAAESFNKGSIVSPQELVSGKIAGVQITSTGGEPGGKSTIRVRGGSSLSASNDPLIVIDGVPVESDDISGMSNPLSTINPNDIETFTVLKDASATAIFGSRASNGVILITTKKGSGKGMKISYTGNISVGTRTGEIEVLSVDEFKEALGTIPSKNTALALLGTENTDWQKEIFQTAISTDHILGIQGGIFNIPYRASVGYSNQNGLLKTSNMERFTGSLNLNPSLLDDHLKINASIKGMYSNNRFADKGAIGNAITFDPTKPVYDENSKYGGFYTWVQPNGDPNSVAPSNPLAMLELKEDLSNVLRSIGSAQFDYKFHFLPELRANLNLGYDYSKSDGTVYIPDFASWKYDAVNGGGEDKEYSQTKRNELLDFYLNYVKDIEAIDSRIDIMGGYSWQHLYKTNYVKSTNIAGTKNLELANNDPTEYYLVSFFGRLNYTLKDRYLLTATLRQDGTSRFSPGTRWGLFPAVALAWKIKEEEFLKDIDLLSDLKLRLGWGVTGQQNIGQGDYPYLAIYTTSQDNARYLFGNTYVSTLRPEGYDALVKWEETTTYNVGFDYGFLKNRITGSVDLYQRDTKDLLNEINIPAGTNFTNRILTNVGNMTNKGIEFTINGKLISNRDLKWDLGFNLTYNENTITKLTNSSDPDFLGVETGGISGGVGSNIQIHSVDYPKNSYFVWEQVYTPEGKPIEGLYVDRNKDGQITNDDRYRYHTPDANVFMGFSTKLEYKNFDAALGGRINLGNWVYNNLNSRTNFSNNLYWSSNYLVNLTKDYLNTRFNTMRLFSDYYVQNASFLRIDHLTLGYNLPKVAKNMNLRLFGSVQNVLVLTKYAGLDPEVEGGIDNNVYPRPRTFTLGVSVEF